jgi:hypothetical protein
MTLIPMNAYRHRLVGTRAAYGSMVVLWLAAKSSGEMETLTTQLLTYCAHPDIATQMRDPRQQRCF